MVKVQLLIVSFILQKPILLDKGLKRQHNHLGQEIVEDILFDEATIVKKRFLSPMLKKRYPNIKYFLEVKADYGNGPGIRYSDQYEFITFLEP